ncbi:DUF4126 family protein [Mycolicibacterium sp.]|jgi:uncharacterized membrane protein|uniref:DUF4126 family protein n=1 Tax=Mycolicibacterium sp. TaxID=2320850 RepID=UPI001A1F385D|nr:DUF4126 family protein [Mycolicibacterium sp.]MBJ7399765.1 DUF4126 family protein [Mycolicibacterium sp.]
MTHALVLLLALLIGVVAGLRAFTAPAVLAWAAFLQWINLSGTWASWMGHWATVAILTVLAVAELVSDKMPTLPSRKSAPQFLLRLAAGAFSGAVLGTAWGYRWGSLGAGMIGAVVGTIGGFAVRTALVRANGGNDRPVALGEDIVAVIAGVAAAYAISAL